MPASTTCGTSTSTIPRDRLTVITGLSGSGKSSLAFDTIYAEGQRRYVESLSAYARQFLGLMEKPDVDAIEGLSPAISIEQKTTGQNPRSTVGTVTEIYDYLRLLWARAGTPHCPNDGEPRRAAERQRRSPTPCWRGRRRRASRCSRRSCAAARASSATSSRTCRSDGFVRVRVDGETYELGSVPALNRRQNHDIAVVVDRVVVRAADRARLADSIETALKLAEGIVEVVPQPGAGKALAPRSSPSASRARCADSRSPSSSRGSSRSTAPSARAPTATVSACARK